MDELDTFILKHTFGLEKMSNDIWCGRVSHRDGSNWHGTPILIPHYIKWLVSLVFAKVAGPHMHNRSLHRLPCTKWGLSMWSLDGSLHWCCWHMESGCGWSSVGFIVVIFNSVLFQQAWFSMEASVSGVLSERVHEEVIRWRRTRRWEGVVKFHFAILSTIRR